MKKTLLSAVLIAPMLVSTASADTSFGIGFGSLYNGLGLNLGKSNGTNLSFVALGCIGWSFGTASPSDADMESGTSSNRSCGIGFGFISTAAFSGSKHGLGLSVGLNYDTRLKHDTGINYNEEDSIEWNLTPSYHFFFNGVSQQGMNLGFGPRLTFRDGESVDAGLMLNLGFQF